MSRVRVLWTRQGPLRGTQVRPGMGGGAAQPAVGSPRWFGQAKAAEDARSLVGSRHWLQREFGETSFQAET